VLFITSMAMKCGAVPLHMWEPDAYGQAPAGIPVFGRGWPGFLYGMLGLHFRYMGRPFMDQSCMDRSGLWLAFDVHRRRHGGHTKGSKTVNGLPLYLADRLHAHGNWPGPTCPVKSTSMSEFGFTAMKGGIFHIERLYPLVKLLAL